MISPDQPEMFTFDSMVNMKFVVICNLCDHVYWSPFLLIALEFYFGTNCGFFLRFVHVVLRPLLEWKEFAWGTCDKRKFRRTPRFFVAVSMGILTAMTLILSLHESANILRVNLAQLGKNLNEFRDWRWAFWEGVHKIKFTILTA